MKQGDPLQCASQSALFSSHLQPQDQSPAVSVLRRTLDSAMYLRLFVIDDVHQCAPSCPAVVMDTMAVSLTSRINPSAIRYEGLARRPRDTSMSGTCFSHDGHDSCDRPVNLGSPSCPCASQTIILCEQAGPATFAPTLAPTRASTTRKSWDLVSSGPSLQLPVGK